MPKATSKLLNHFTNNPVSLDISRSVFDLNHSFTCSFNLGDVIPIFVSEILPGDTVSIDTTSVIRAQPMVTPVMSNIYFDTYYFFVPNRLIWQHWVNFMGENTENAWIPSVEYTVPQITIPSGGYDECTIADYMGVPIKQGAGTTINALPFRGYAKIMSDWFRDENLQDPCHITMDETTLTGVNTGDQVTDIEKGGKPFIACRLPDRFSTALLAPQKGPAVTFDLAGYAPVLPNATLKNFDIGDSRPVGTSPIHWLTVDSNDKFAKPNPSGRVYSIFTNSTDDYGWGSSAGLKDSSDGNVSTASPYQFLYPNNLYADMSSITQFSVNELRTAFAIQRFYERMARSGSRYIEFISSFFNVRSSDARLQRSEYLGGSRMSINVSQIENVTNTTDNVDPIGSVAGLSVTGNTSSDFTWSAEEHGYIIGVGVARIQHQYQNGLEPHWLRKTFADYYNPVFANLGEQKITNDQVYLGTNATTNKQVFGYQEAWSEYRFKPNHVAGEMRSNATTSLDMWHLADDYSSLPTLGDSWIREDKTLLDRCLAVTSSVSNQFLADFWFECSFARPMPLYSIPGLIDHH